MTSTVYSFALSPRERVTTIHQVCYRGRPTGYEHATQMAALIRAREFARSIGADESLMSVQSVRLDAPEVRS